LSRPLPAGRAAAGPVDRMARMSLPLLPAPPSLPAWAAGVPVLAALLLAAAPLQAAPPADAAAAAAAAATPRSAKAPDPAVTTVIEDDGVRIEETRVRGAVARLRVQSKVGEVPAYDIQVAPPGRESMSDRGLTGQRTWSLLRF
jgi:hypothetical protein